MNFRKLGKTDFSVSEIGLGCWQFGGDFGPIEEQQAIDTLKAAQNAGITFLDTADVYGDGASENVIGEHRVAHEDAVIATKVGRSTDLYPSHYDYETIRTHLLDSCRRLKVESLDLIQLHCIPLSVLQRGTVFDWMEHLKAEGLIRHWGVSVETIEEAQLCLEQPHLASIQIIFNLFRQDAAWELFEKANDARVGIIVRLPLASGLLTGKFHAQHQFAATDHRHYNANGASFSVGETFSGIEFEKAVSLVERLENLRASENAKMSLAQFSLRWILDFPAVSTVIAGCSRAEQAVANASATRLPPLSPELHAKLKAFYLDHVRSHVRCPI